MCICLLFVDNVLLFIYLLLLWFLWKERKIFTGSYYTLTRGLALSDIDILIVAFWYLVAEMFDQDTRVQILWVAWYFNFAIAYFPSLFLTVLVTLNRFVAIVFFGQYNKWFTVKKYVSIVI